MQSPSRASWAHKAALISVSCSPQPDTRRNRKITDTGLMHHVVCLFTAQLSLVLNSWPHGDGTLSWRWYTIIACNKIFISLSVVLWPDKRDVKLTDLKLQNSKVEAVQKNASSLSSCMGLTAKQSPRSTQDSGHQLVVSAYTVRHQVALICPRWWWCKF